MISALAKSTWCMCQALSKGFLLLLVFPWQALPKGLLHVHSIPNNGVLVLLATPWQALSKGLLHVERNKTFLFYPGKHWPKVCCMCKECAEGVLFHPGRPCQKVCMYIVLPMFHPGGPCPKACWKCQMKIVKKYAVPGLFLGGFNWLFYWFFMFFGETIYWFSCPRNLCFLLIRSTHRINICNWFHGNFFQHNFPYWLGSITDAQGTLLLSNESNLRQIYSQTNLLSNESNLRRFYCQTNLISY